MNKVISILIVVFCCVGFVAHAQNIVVADNEGDENKDFPNDSVDYESSDIVDLLDKIKIINLVEEETDMKSLMSNEDYLNYLKDQGEEVVNLENYVDDFNNLMAEAYGGKSFNYVDESGAEYYLVVHEYGMSASIERGDAKGLKKLVVPAVVEGLETSFRVDEIGKEAFAFYGEGADEPMKGVEKLVIPEGVFRVGENTFGGACDLQEVELPSTLQNLSVSMFADCHNLKSVSIPSDSGLIMIGDYAFDQCKSLKSFVIPAGVRYIGNSPWRGCTSIKSVTYQVEF